MNVFYNIMYINDTSFGCERPIEQQRAREKMIRASQTIATTSTTTTTNENSLGECRLCRIRGQPEYIARRDIFIHLVSRFR